MFRPSVRMVCKPSSSRWTSSGVLPCTMHQYWLGTTGMFEIKKYFCSTSSDAVVPAGLAETTAAPGLYATFPPPV